MNEITALALLVSKAKASVFTMEYISQFEASDIDSDDVDLRFEVDGVETGTNVSIVDECGQAAQIITALVEALEAKNSEAEWMRKRIEELASSREVSEEQRTKWFQIAEALGEKMDVADKLIAELERGKVAYESVAMALRDDMREPRTVTVKLPSLKQTESGERYVWSDGVHNFKADVIEILRAAGIQVIEGEGQCGGEL